MILSDVVPLRKAEATKVKAKPYKEVEEATTNFLRRLEFLQSLREASYEEQQALRSLEKKGIRDLDTKVIKLAMENGGAEVPEIIIQQNSIGAKIAQTPQADLAELRRIADLLGFLIIPFEYLHPDSYSQESYNMQATIKTFSQQVEKWFTPYVVTPPVFYNVEAHASAETDLPIYSGPLTSQAMMALSMSMPMFRSLLRNLKSLAQNNREIQQQLQGVQQEISGIKSRLVALETYVEQQIQIQVQAERQRQAAAAAAEAAATRMLQYEPMLIGIPKGQNVHANCNVLVGPCWGPDFEDIVFTALQLRKVKDQRAALAKKANLFLPESRYY